jgi:uncharacterized membrane protein (UPF0127 family)
MKKIFGLILAVIIIGIGIFVYKNIRSSPNVKASTSQMIRYQLENKQLKLYIADSPEEHAQGLMYYRKLDKVDGMIFLFPEKKQQSFWNKNTFMDLDVYWIDQGKVVGKSMLPSIEKSKDVVYVQSPQAIDTVIEVVRR